MAIDYAALVPLVTAGVGAASSIAASRQAARERQATAQVPVDQINQVAHRTDVDAKQEGLKAQDAALIARAAGMLSEQAAARKAPGERASTSVRGDILANAVDSTFNGGGNSRIPKFSFEGGLHPGMFSGNTRKLGAEMSRAALLDQLSGEKTPFADLPAADFSSVIDSKAPGATALPQGGKLDSVLDKISEIGGIGAPLAIEIAKQQAAKGNKNAPIPAPQVTPGAPAGLYGNVAPPAPPPVPGTFLQQPQPMSSPRPFSHVQF